MKFFKVLVVGVVALGLFLFWRDRSRNYDKVLLTSQENKDIETLQIGTYNIKTLNNGHSLKEVIEDLKEANLDVICFQEVDERSWRSHNIDMMKEIAESLGYEYHYFYPAMFLGKGYYGLGIVSRYPLMEVGSTSLQVSLLREPRILAYAKIDVGKQPLDVYMTHLSFRPLKDKYRQMASLKKQFENCKNTILIGDFNIFKDADFFEIKGMSACNQAENKYLTFMDFGFPDNIFYSNDLMIDALNVQQTSFSDHHLFCGTLHLK